MSSLLISLLLPILLAATPEKSTERLEDLVSKYRQDDAPIILFFTAEWCTPCKQFKQEVLTKPAVVDALKNAHFVVYDIDTDVGHAASEKYDIRGIPAVISIDKQAKLQSVLFDRSKKGVEHFVQFVAEARFFSLSEPQLMEKVKAARDDAATLFRAGQWFQRRNRYAEAYALYGRIDPRRLKVDRDTEQRAAWGKVITLQILQRRELARNFAFNYLEKYPASRHARQCLLTLVLDPTVSGPQLEEIAKKYLASHRYCDNRMRDVVYFYLAGNRPNLALNAAQTYKLESGHSPAAWALLAEVFHWRGEHRPALDAAKHALDSAKEPHEKRVYESNYERYTKGGGPSPEIVIIQKNVKEYLAQLDGPDASIVFLAAYDPTAFYLSGSEDNDTEFRFIQETFPILSVTESKCADFAGKSTTVHVHLRLNPDGGRPLRVLILENDLPKELEQCIRDTLEKEPLPRAPEMLRNTFNCSLSFRK
ncbi:MAG: thioredoxin family protein [Deltaproteobacteria bacterium]|nr:thioredoxin family protein [Deltaproteobacteria bacterium]